MATYNKRDIQNILRKNGYYFDHCTGGHAIYKKSGVAKTISIGLNHCNKMVMRRLIKENNLIV